MIRWINNLNVSLSPKRFWTCYVGTASVPRHQMAGGAGLQCRVLQGAEGFRRLQRQSRSQTLNTARRRTGGGPAPKWRFIFSGSTLSCLHPSSGSQLWGLPLIRLCRPSSLYLRSSLCSLYVSFLSFPPLSPLSMFMQPSFCCELPILIFLLVHFVCKCVINVKHFFL